MIDVRGSEVRSSTAHAWNFTVLPILAEAWCRGLTCGPVKAEIAGSNPVASAIHGRGRSRNGWPRLLAGGRFLPGIPAIWGLHRPGGPDRMTSCRRLAAGSAGAVGPEASGGNERLERTGRLTRSRELAKLIKLSPDGGGSLEP